MFALPDRRRFDHPAVPPRSSRSADGLVALQTLVGNAAIAQAIAHSAALAVQRDEYTPITGEEERQQQAATTSALQGIDAVLGRVADAEAASDLREALVQYRGPASRRVPVRYGRLARPGQTGGEYRPHLGRRGTVFRYIGGRVPLDQTLVHEAVHALHFNRHPELRRLVPDAHGFEAIWNQATNGSASQRRAAHNTLRALAFTEYWAARRTAEYRRASDPHDPTLRNPDVEGRTWQVARCLILLRQAGISFDPATSSRLGPDTTRGGTRRRSRP